MNAITSRPPPHGVEAWPGLPGIDAAAAKEYCGNSLELFKRLLVLLRKNYGDWSGDWLAVVSAGSASSKADLCASLHKLRGGASTIGASHLALVAGQVEHSLKEGQVQPLEAVQRVGEMLDRLLVQVGEWQESAQARGG
ncbi:Hpt domain-containing protein [Hydrogenophaga sp.]|uniref:Hpt domain-containing protein n=1 Tax=Hydrogenophaga sp. TaxID=1904254 RepID=UPI0027314EE2|nr:Hpt domain-containing protein [Hydrogenophaga sp.]MDP2016402.1 Hpt domain-containing protein [Hydrogenophaga sp.]MDP3166159.1 Hpt domain-containing protein [Hydrogenophaga sp.]MDP3812342.1 Hpt domain-containing protein [Hydrogenophaga sp.]